MLRIVATLAALAVFPTASLAARRADTPVAGSPLIAKVVNCDVTNSTDRSATFFARMDTQPAASKLQIRFQLLERLGAGAPWTRLDVPALRGWDTSQAGVKRFGWKQTLDGLHNGGAYKVRVQYRWLSPAGRTVDTETRDSPVCRGPLPNITIGDLSGKPGPAADTRTYRIVVQNTGKVDADQVDVQMSVDKAVLDTITLSHLDAGDSRTVSFSGPVCRHGVHVYVDPGNSIGESVEDDNSQLFACP